MQADGSRAPPGLSMAAIWRANDIMQNIIIVGAGAFGREVCCWLEDMLDSSTMRIAGFLDDTRAKAPHLNENYRYPLLGSISDYEVGNHDAFIIAIGDPAAKLRLASTLREKGGAFFTLVHPTALLARTANIGAGVIVCPFALVSADTRIGDFVTINTYSSIGHDAVIAQGTTISCHVDITGGVIIGEGVFLGSNASVLPNVRIGDGAKVGAGAIVMRKVDAGSTVYTMPAKKL